MQIRRVPCNHTIEQVKSFFINRATTHFWHWTAAVHQRDRKIDRGGYPQRGAPVDLSESFSGFRVVESLHESDAPVMGLEDRPEILLHRRYPRSDPPSVRTQSSSKWLGECRRSRVQADRTPHAEQSDTIISEKRHHDCLLIAGLPWHTFIESRIKSVLFATRIGNCSPVPDNVHDKLLRWEIHRETSLPDPDIVPHSTVRANQRRFSRRRNLPN